MENLTSNHKLVRRLTLEEVEQRMLLSADFAIEPPAAVQDASSKFPVLIGHEHLPDFAAYPTLVTVQSGDWSNPATWGGRLPKVDEVVVVDANHQVTIAADDLALVRTVGVSGSLTIRGELKTGELLVYESGHTEMQAGSVLTIRDIAIDKTSDPLEWGTGVIVLGHFESHGTEKTAASRAAGHILNGSTSITLEGVPADWEVGDQVLIPTTDQQPFTDRPDSVVKTLSAHDEVRRITAIQGNRIILDMPLTADHLGVENAEFGVTRFAHVMNLTRDVTIRSENPEGTRGHFAFAHRGYVDVEFTQFDGLGRTDSAARRDSTILADDGTVLHAGSNQSARYVLHAHHTVGLAGGRADSPYQSTIVGNVLTSSPSWGIVLHASDDILVKDNVVHAVSGAGIVTEDGSELRNVITGNVIVGTRGITGGNVDKRGGVFRDRLTLSDGTVETVISFATLGDGIWLTHAGNQVTDNVVYSSQGYGLNVNAYYIGSTNVRLERGSKVTTHVPVVQPSLTGVEISGLETVSSRGLFWATHSTHKRSEADVVYSDFLGWNLSGQFAITAYHERGLRLEDFTVIFNPAASAARDAAIETEGLKANIGFFGNRSYALADTVIANLRVYGAWHGISTPGAIAHRDSSNELRFEGGMLLNFTNILANSSKKDVEITFNGVEMRELINPVTGTHDDVVMNFQFDPRRHMNGAETKIVIDGIRQWFDVQDPTFVLPQLSGRLAEKAVNRFGFDPSGLTSLEFSQRAGYVLGGGFRPALWQEIFEQTGTVLG